MKDISNSMMQKLLFVITIFINGMFVYAQNSSELLGCWTECNTGAVYEKINGTFVETSWGTKGNSLRRMLLMPDSIGAYYDEANAVNKTYFSWWATDSIYTFHESPECPYTEESLYRIMSSEKYDTLYIEQRYKNPNYRTLDTYVRSKVSLEKTSEHFDVRVNRTDNYLAYNNRIIEDQRPYVYPGRYQNNVIEVGRQIAKWLDKMTVSDIVEIHIINSPLDSKSRIDIFIIMYDTNSRQIANISYAGSYTRKTQ